MIPEPVASIYNKYLSEKDREKVKDLAFKSAAVATSKKHIILGNPLK